MDNISSDKNKIKHKKVKHLGRGLQSLLGPITSAQEELDAAVQRKPADISFPQDKELHNSLQHIELSKISPNPYQPRTVWDDSDLEDLAESIKISGIIQPIVVRRSPSGFELIAGERRFRASKLADLKTIPALVRKATDSQLLELALIENIHRKNLNAIERAKAYHNFVETFSLNQTQAAQRLGENRSVVANYLRLLDLPIQIQQMLTENKLSMGHARAILALSGDELKRKIANLAIAGRLSVREVERMVRKQIVADPKKEKTKTPPPPHIFDLERKLTSQLGTKVNIQTKKNRESGKIVIEFYNLDDFDRITEQIGLNVAGV